MAKECWVKTSSAEIICQVIVVITLLASLFFLINALRVIVTVMHPNSPNPVPLRTRRAVRAALILIPLFGLQFIITPFRPSRSHPFERAYDYLLLLTTTMQGIAVSVLFCFANHDVHQAIRGLLHRRYRQSYRLTTTSNNQYCQYTGTVIESGVVYVINGTGRGSDHQHLASGKKNTLSMTSRQL